MILYFSATGNSLRVAQRLAEVIGCEVRNIETLLSEQPEGDITMRIQDGGVLGIVSPTYFWGLPRILQRLLCRLHVEGAGYRFFATSYGSTTGQIGTFARHMAQQCGWDFDALYSIRMPDVWTPMFNLSDKTKVDRRVQCAEQELDRVAADILARRTGNMMRHRVPMLLSRLYHWYGFHTYTTRRFQVSAQDCIGCGLCAQRCPAHAITMRDGLPHWEKTDCELCLGCLHRCPKFAIQYGSNTRKHGQYRNPNAKWHH